MKAEKIKLSVQGVRAIESADIVIGDITVLSGVNASGKSTLAHLVHSLVNLNREYSSLAMKMAWRRVGRVLNYMNRMYERIAWELRKVSDPDYNYFPDYEFVQSSFRKDEDNDARANKVLAKWHETMEKYREFESLGKQNAQRILKSFCSAVMTPDRQRVGLEECNQWVANLVESAKADYIEYMKHRTKKVWRMANRDAIHWISYPGEVKLFEGGNKVYDSELDFGGISEILNIEHAFYVESPWRNLPSDNGWSNIISINDGFDSARPDKDFEPDESFFKVIGGNVRIKKEEEFGADNFRGSHYMWVFERTDGGGEYPLEECATGIKAFSILNYLYTTGVLDNRTLLIVDEPESHLHPQWILEYAKILVRLNRNLGVRLLLATHSPDMLNAIRRVANVEQVPDLRFYLAEKASLIEPMTYNFVPLGRNVEQIFRAFNLAADKTEAYPMEII